MKDFIIIGNINCITYKEVFPYIKNNIIRVGYSLNATKCIFTNGRQINNAIWFTTIMRSILPLKLIQQYSPDKYPKYDNYDAINVDRVKDIPYDYNGVMGVPISFILKYCPEQFEIVKFRKGNDDKDLAINGKTPYFRILIRKQN